MKKVIAFVLAAALAVLMFTAFRIRQTVTYTGVRIAAVPVVANGSIIKMELSPSRANQTIREVTYEIADTDTMNVHMVLDFLERNEEQESQTLQLLITTQTKVNFIVNDKPMNVSLVRDGIFWKVSE